MALFGRVLGTTLLIGGGALAVAAVVAAPRVLRASRPIMRQALRRGMDLYGKVRAAAAELVDDVEDLVAEVRAEASADDAAVDSAETVSRA